MVNFGLQLISAEVNLAWLFFYGIFFFPLIFSSECFRLLMFCAFDQVSSYTNE